MKLESNPVQSNTKTQLRWWAVGAGRQAAASIGRTAQGLQAAAELDVARVEVTLRRERSAHTESPVLEIR
jgi:hypothetical protein